MLAYVPDLMDRSRLGGGDTVEFVADLAGLDAAGTGDTVMIDLGRAGALTAATDAAVRGAHVIGFAAHVDGDLLDRAAAAGVEALPRSRFFRRVAELS